MTTRPSREQFTAAYLDPTLTVMEVCRRFAISDTTCSHWARRFGLAPRKTGGYRPASVAPRIVLKAEENHCEPVNDGPAWGDPTPEQIAELAASCRARNILTMQTMQDEHCEHRQAGRCWRCRRGLT